MYSYLQVTHISGIGNISGPNEVTVAKSDGGTEKVSTKNILIATGSDIMGFPGVEVLFFYSNLICINYIMC